jgi:hypothetical protein
MRSNRAAIAAIPPCNPGLRVYASGGFETSVGRLLRGGRPLFLVGVAISLLGPPFNSFDDGGKVIPNRSFKPNAWDFLKLGPSANAFRGDLVSFCQKSRCHDNRPVILY